MGPQAPASFAQPGEIWLRIPIASFNYYQNIGENPTSHFHLSRFSCFSIQIPTAWVRTFKQNWYTWETGIHTGWKAPKCDLPRGRWRRAPWERPAYCPLPPPWKATRPRIDSQDPGRLGNVWQYQSSIMHGDGLWGWKQQVGQRENTKITHYYDNYVEPLLPSMHALQSGFIRLANTLIVFESIASQVSIVTGQRY